MASGAIKGITIEFRGDTTKLGKALNDVNKEIRTTDSALREVDKALKLDPTNVELLAQKEELLNKQIEQTKEKLELQKTAAHEAAQALEEGTITQEEYAKLSAEVATTASKLNDLESSASGASTELSETAQSAEEVGEATEQSGNKFAGWAEVVASAASIGLEAMKAVGEAIAEVAQAMVEMTNETAGYADEVLTLSSTSGVAVDTIQALQYGEEQLDVSLGTVTGSISKIIRAMDNAQGTQAEWQEQVDELNAALASGEISAEDYQEAITDLGTSGTAFDELGVDILDAQGNLRDSEEVFWDVIDALGTIENATQRDAVAMSLLGRSAMQLNPLIEAGSEGFREIYEEAEEAGAIMGGDALEAFDEYNDTLSRLDQGTNAAKRAIGSILLPVLDELASDGVDLLSDFTNGILSADGDIEQMGEVISQAVTSISEILNGDLISQMIDIGSSLIQTLVGAVLANMDSILQMGFDLLMTILQGIVDNLSSLGPVVANMIVTLANFIVSNLPTVITSAIQIIVAVVDGISRALPELIPAAVACVNQIVGALIDNLDLLIPAALELMLALALGLIAAIPDLLDCIPTIGNALKDELIELGPSLADAALTWGADLIDSFISGITGSIGRLTSTLSDLASTVTDYIGFSVPEKGPLHEWAYNNPGADMIDLFTQGMDDEEVALQRALYGTSNTIMNGMDYTSQLSGIASQLAGIGVGGSNQPINIFIGTQRVATVVANANAENNYRTGGL